MASAYGTAKSVGGAFGDNESQKMQGVENKLQGNWNNAVSGDPVENLDPRIAISKAAEALDHPEIAGHPLLSYAAPELLAAHHFGEHGNGPLQDWYANQGGETG
jgi:hypothetical protein